MTVLAAPSTRTTQHAPHLARYTILLITLLAFALRVWQLANTPPGWRDDELINSLVISQKFLDGNFAVYYPDASGHEALYHALNAIMLHLFGPNAIGIRYLSTLLGTLTIPLTYLLGKRLFNDQTGLIAATALSLSFWSLIYSRIGLRHILAPLLALLAFHFFWKTFKMGDRRLETKSLNTDHWLLNTVLAALFTALGFYTYFASRGVPLILIAFCIYLSLFSKGVFKKYWRWWLMMFGLTAVLILPLIINLQNQPPTDNRVAELAVPITEARLGNYQSLLDYTSTTLSMFHATGDNESLYNIPNRPIFGTIPAIVFWIGIAITIGLTLYNLRPTPHAPHTPSVIPHQLLNTAPTFLLFWWLAGISPAFISVPPASLGHTILAQPATYLLLALPLGKLWQWKPTTQLPKYLFILLTILLVIPIASRDLPDYFTEWPQKGLVRFLYRANYAEIADFLNEHPDITDFGITSFLAGPWDKLALKIDVERDIRPRWYNPERVFFINPNLTFFGFPEADTNFAFYDSDALIINDQFQLGTINMFINEEGLQQFECFQNGLCVLPNYARSTETLDLIWWVKRPLSLPPIPLISNPPPPNTYAGPRLSIFAQTLTADGQFLAGDDGLWIDPTTVQEGDIFIQQHFLPPPSDGGRIIFGLYDPMTGERILTKNGRESLEIGE